MKFSQAFSSMAVLVAPIVQLAAALPMSDEQALVRRGEAVWKPFTQCVKDKHFLLTFQNGPSQNMETIIEKLNKKKVPALFFLMGSFGKEHWEKENCIYKYAKTLRDAFAAGHDFGSQTWNGNFIDLAQIHDRGRIIRELDLLDSALKRIIGGKAKLFSPPLGNQPSDEALRIITDKVSEGGHGMIPVTFNLNTGNMANSADPASDLKKTEQMFEGFASTSGISLMRNDEGGVIEKVIDTLQNKGYKLVPAWECFGLPDQSSLYVDYHEGAALSEIQADWATDEKPCYEI